MSCPGSIGGAVPISTSGNRANGWPLNITSNNKLRRHSRKMFPVNSSYLTSGPCPLKINVFFFRRVYNLYSLIAPLPNWRGYSLILWILKTASDLRLSGSSITSKDAKWGYLAHGGEWFGGKELWLSEVHIESNMEEKGIVVICRLRRIGDPKAGTMGCQRVYFFIPI